ncbi:MAG: tRNA (adenosine(37)-N6)-threonylcarbamoyltransferase complex dimerization subunit type 1 TsaB [Alphaproteobacteria bacterium]|nr:tRNA (adenosine(37)-N6)-threonylcarbamoyltransferase complex dimerization subunit type 1 TsaB [Alphaproteobacteria bacterium]
MYILAFDTTASACSVALYKDDVLIADYLQVMDYGQSEVLLPAIQELLKKATINFSDIEVLFVCVGPGSFTGVRSSISAARTLNLASPELTLGGVSVFDAYIQELSPDEVSECNAVIVETKREDFYVQLYDADLQKTTPPQALTYDSIIALLRNKKVSLIGDGVERFLSRPSGLSIHCIKMDAYADINNIIKAGMKQYQNKLLDYPKPLYLRAPDVSAPKA